VQPPRSQVADRLWSLNAKLFGLRALLGLISAIFNIDAPWYRYGLEMPGSIASLTVLAAFVVVRGREILQFRRERPPSDSPTPANGSA